MDQATGIYVIIIGKTSTVRQEVHSREQQLDVRGQSLSVSGMSRSIRHPSQQQIQMGALQLSECMSRFTEYRPLPQRCMVLCISSSPQCLKHSSTQLSSLHSLGELAVVLCCCPLESVDNVMADDYWIIPAVVAGTMFNIILLALALRIICRRYASVHHADLSSSGQLRARGDVESPQLKQHNATVVVQPDDQVSQRIPILNQAEDE